MNNIFEIKYQLLNVCIEFVENKHNLIVNSIASYQNDLLSETKSSVGDKHETGRAMLQLEMEKASLQLEEVSKMQQTLRKISIENSSKIIGLGALVITTKGTYFLAISIGKIVFNRNDYFVISAQSPIGMQLVGKKLREIIPFNNAEILEIH
jgi:hypothetical protein